MLQIGVLADDLTGANDTGIQFRKTGLVSQVTLLRKDTTVTVPVCEAWIIDVKSRGCSAASAYELNRQAASAMKAASPGIMYKKIDSTLRGNIGAECDAVLDVFQDRILIMAPAYPELGRTTRNGIQYLHGVPIDQTELSKDPISPVLTGNIEKALSVQSKHESALIHKRHLESVRLFKEQLSRFIRAGVRILIADAENDRDLDQLVNIAGSSGVEPIWVGSAGLASALSRKIASECGMPEWPMDSASQMLVVSGSQTELSRLQLEALSRYSGMKEVRLASVDLLEAEDAGRLKGFQEAAQELARGKHAIFALAKESGGSLKNYAAQQGKEYSGTVRELAGKFGEAVNRLIRANPQIGWLIAIGGDTARAICDALGTDSLRLADEWLPGVIHAQCSEPEGLQLITKSGSFGDHETLVHIFNRIGAFYE
ncbi:four-carbon acid sugar kinase family protein [Ferviditalea candida]|uniref:Four-carbon acid sugar kinase family protein n=1 Tax=Ferviditalea candida TaxID=3108399 RepID=A0ABU5ZCT3_9BACL|nr:four-carbon acid sugar kinase family protein [Paenibacillaceae bacterium T2]